MLQAPMEISCAHPKQDDDDSGVDDNQQPREQWSDELVLIPGLPNHLAQLCLSSLDPFLLYSVCRSWRRFIYSPDFPRLYSLYALLCPTSSSSLAINNNIELYSFDPISSKWNSLPSPPPLPFLYRHPSFISRKFPIQCLTASGRLLLIAATTHNFLPALHRPLVFDPPSKKWFFGPPLHTPRRWCITAAGNSSVHGSSSPSSSSSSSSVYVASGVGSRFQRDVARTVEKWNMINIKNADDRDWKWEKVATYKDVRFSREANEAVEYKGKLCMVNIKGHAVNKDGAVYNTLTNQWEEMPPGMLSGWQGPAAMDHERQVMYVVDEANGALSRYVPDDDRWEEVIKSPENLKGASQIAAGRGRVCAVCGNNNGDGTARITIVDVVNNPARIWVVNPPPQMEVISVHILPTIT